jgi:hemolysin III
LPHDRPRARLRDPFPALSHWAGAALSLAGLVVLLRRSAGRPWLDVAAFSVYGVTLVQLYVASALAHSVHCSPEAEDRLTRLDYAAIFLLIAGTYTPFCVVTLRGAWGWALLAAIWAIAAVGIVMVFARSPSARARVLTYVAMAWICLFATGPMVRALPPPALVWLLAGGVIYTSGAAVYFADRPHLWPGRFAAHDLWHCMVLAGSACHFVAVAVYVAR